MLSFKSAWEQTVESLEGVIPSVAMQLWIKTIYPIDIYNGEAVLYVEAPFTRDVIYQRYASMLETKLSEKFNTELKLRIYTEEDKPANLTVKLPKKPSEEEPVEEMMALSENGEKSYKAYTFENFVVGSSNTFAHAACTAVCKRPGSIYNPLFIYGDSGLGKTHLLNAIRNKMEERFSDANVVYIKCEDFVNEMVRAIQSGGMNGFKDKYRKADVLLVDDIQFIGKSEGFQEEFFHTFNTLYESGKQIILTSDRTPKEIPLLEDRLRTRFESGLIADIQSPDYELRIAIIRNKIESYNIPLNEDIIFFLAEKLKNNVRQLEGVLKNLMAVYDLTGITPTLTLAQNAVSKIMNENIPNNILIDKVLIETSRYFDVPIDDIKSKKRLSKIVNARQIGMYIMTQMSDMSLETIGMEFGNKDHATVHHSVKVVEDNIARNPRIKQTIDEIIANIRNK